MKLFLPLVVIGTLILGGCGLSSGQNLGVTNTRQPTSPTASGQGIIEGWLSFPSEKMPDDLQICAENTSTDETVCTSEKAVDETDTFKVTYQLNVPNGDYLVYSKTDNIKGYKAYYSEFVKCGMNVDCNNHTPIRVEVKSNEKASEINPNDWYNIQNQ